MSFGGSASSRTAVGSGGGVSASPSSTLSLSLTAPITATVPSTAAVLTSAKLVSLTLACYSSLNALRVTPATHIDTFLRDQKLDGTDPDSRAAADTLRELVYGLLRYESVLSLTVDGLYSARASSVARSDRPLYLLFTMLAMFKLSELGVEGFKELVGSQGAHKMAPLLSFLFDKEARAYPDGWLAQQWQRVYDGAFVRDTLCKQFDDVAPEIDALIEALEVELQPASHAATGEVADGKVGVSGVPVVAKKPPTVPQPFALTAPRVRLLPAPPFAFDSAYKANPVPAAVLDAPSLADLEQKAIERRRSVEAATLQKHRLAAPPKLSTHARGSLPHAASEKRRLLAEQAAAKEKEEAERLLKARPPPKTTFASTSTLTAKTTAASILREDLFHKKKAAEEKAQMEKFEMALRDEADFLAWRREQEAADDRKREEEIRQRKLDAVEASHAVLAALEAQAREKHETVETVKAELAALNAAKTEALQRELEQKQAQAKRIQEEKSGIVDAIRQTVLAKQQKAEEVVRLKTEAEAAKKIERAKDLEAKRQVIRSIQAMEHLASVRSKKPKVVDPTSTSGIGVLEEMSLVELATRLENLRREEAAVVEERRKQIREQQDARKTVLDAMVKRNEAKRSERAKEAEVERRERREVEEAVRREAEVKLAKEAKVLAVRQAVTTEARKAEASQLAHELRAKKIQSSFYAHAKVAQAQQRQQDLAKGRERVAKMEEGRAAEEARVQQNVAYAAEQQRRRLERQRNAARLETRKAADAVLEQREQEAEEFLQEQEALYGLQSRAIKTERDAQMKAHREINPYAKHIADREARRAQHKAKLATATASRTLPRDAAGVISSTDDEVALSRHLKTLDAGDVAKLDIGLSESEDELSTPAAKASQTLPRSKVQEEKEHEQLPAQAR